MELGDGSVLLAELPQGVSRFRVVLQVDANDFYLVLGGPEEREVKPLWKVRRDRTESVLATLRSPSLEVTTPVRFLRVEGLRGVGARSVAGLRLDREPVRVAHSILVAALVLPILGCAAIHQQQVEQMRADGDPRAGHANPATVRVGALSAAGGRAAALVAGDGRLGATAEVDAFESLAAPRRTGGAVDEAVEIANDHVRVVRSQA